MKQNIVEDLVIPEVPKVIPNQEMYVYVPVATYENKGIANFDSVSLTISNGTVSVKESFVDSKIVNGIVQASGQNLELTIDNSTFVLTAKLKNGRGEVLGEVQTVDLPLESVVVDGSYDNESKTLVLTLQNSNNVNIPISDLINGLVSIEYFEANASLLKGGTPIAEGTDLNTLTTPGNYYFSPNDEVFTLSNCPVISAFTMKVFYSTENSGYYLKQEIKRYNTSDYLTRHSENAGSTWSPWSKYAIASEVVSKSGGTITGSLVITGDLIVQGTKTSVNTQNLNVQNKLIYVAKDNITALSTPAGLITPYYDGKNSGGIIYDNTGTAYVGDVVLNSDGDVDLSNSNVWPLCARDKSNNWVNGHVPVWDSTNEKLVDSGRGSIEIVQTTGQSTTVVMSQKATTDEIATLKGDLYNLSIGFDTVGNKLLNPSTGNIVDYLGGGFSVSEYISCNGYNNIYVKTPTDASRNYFYDVNKNPLTNGGFVLTKGENIIPVPNGAMYFVLCNKTENLVMEKIKNYVVGEIQEDIKTIDERESANADSFSKSISNFRNGIPDYDSIEGFVLNIDTSSSDFGNPKSNVNFVVSDFISCKGYNSLLCYATVYSSSYNVFYDKDKKPISSFNINTRGDNYVAIPTNAQYFKISAHKDSYYTTVLSLDSVKVVNVYGTGLVLPFTVTKDAKFKMVLSGSAVVNYTLSNSNKLFQKGLADGAEYDIPPYTALIIDTFDNSIKQIPSKEVSDMDIILLQTGAYDNNYTRYFKGYFADRVTVKTSYEEYDKNNVRKNYARDIDDKIVEVIKDNQSDFSFLIVTDMHIVTSSVDGSRPVLNVLNRIQDRVHCDAIFNLGDTVMMGKASTKEAYYSLQEVVGKTADKEKAYFIVGNHDYNHRSDVLDIGQEKSWVLPYMDVYRILGKQHENDVVWGSKERMYYYKDFVEQKIRVIFLNTLDRPEVWETVDGIQKEKYTWLMNVISATQTDWLVDVALNFSDKADKTEWSVIICSHVTPSSTAEWNDAPLLNATVLRQISEAFISGGVKTPSFTDTTFDGWSSYNKTVDFTSQGAMNLIGWFSGHSHIDTHSKVNGVNYVNTVCGYTYNIQDSQAMSSYSMTDGTYTEFGLDVCSLNKAQRKVTLHRFGVGADREITY